MSNAPERLSDQPVLYWFTMPRLPRGQSPENIRLGWIDVPLPLRTKLPIEAPLAATDIRRYDDPERQQNLVIEDAIGILVIDSLKMLRLAGRTTALEWWQVWVNEKNVDPTNFGHIFYRQDGVVVPYDFGLNLYPLAEQFANSQI